MSTFLVRNARIVVPGERILSGDVLVREGKLVEIGAVSASAAAGAPVHDAEGRLLTPGLIDVHTHGVMQSLYEAGAWETRSALRALSQFGVTTVLPTIIPHDNPKCLARLAEIVAVLSSIREVNVPGLHLEGPFMTVGGAACPTLPGDVALLERLFAACAGRIAAMSLSPDAPGIVPVIRRLTEQGVRVFLTHTRAGVEDTEKAIAAGATHATHFYNVFYPPAETEPGVRPVGAVETILADPRVSVDFIADGVHVHPMAIRAAVAAKGWQGVLLITDSNIGAGLPPGVYPTSWGFSVRVSPSTAARHAIENTLAGSALTMDRGVANLLQWLPLPPEQVWAMATLNPARLLGLAGKGRMQVGADADLVLWDADLTARRTWVNGNTVYEKNVV